MISKIFKKNRHHHQHELHCDSLCCARSGQSARILSFAGEEIEAAKLRDLGVREGAVVTVLRAGETLLIGIDDARFAIGRAAAQNVLCALGK